MQLSRLALRCPGGLHRAAVRGRRRPRVAVQRQDPYQVPPGGGEGGDALGLSRSGAGAAGADVGALHLGQRLPPSRHFGNPLQLVPVPGELHRPGPFRMATRELARPRGRDGGSLRPEAPAYRLRGIRLRHNLQADPGEHRRASPALDRRAQLPLAQRAVHRRPFRMAGPDRRRQHAQRRLVLQPGAEGQASLRPERNPLLAGPDQGRGRALDHQPRDEPGFRRLGRPGHARRPVAGTSRPQRPGRLHDAEALPLRHRPRRAERRPQGGRPRSCRQRLHRAPDLRPRLFRRRLGAERPSG